MKKWLLGFCFAGLLLSISFSEPTVTPSGSTEIIGSTGSKGMNSFYSATDLDLDINFSDSISGVVDFRGEYSHSDSSVNLRQGFLQFGNSMGSINHTMAFFNRDYYKNSSVIMKELSKVQWFTLPEQKPVSFIYKEMQKEESLHSIILADLQNRCFPKKEITYPETTHKGFEILPRPQPSSNPWKEFPPQSTKNQESPATVVVGHWVNNQSK